MKTVAPQTNPTVRVAREGEVLSQNGVCAPVVSSADVFAREALIVALGAHIRDAVATGQSSALVLFDINNFAEINASWGVSAGDAVLLTAGLRLQDSVADRLEKVGATSSRVGRLDADHFAIVVSGIRNWGAMRDAVAELVRSLARPYTIEGQSIAVGVRAAIIRIPEHARSVTSALGRGFRLLNNAARLRPDGVALSEQEALQGSSSATLERDLASAIKTDQIFLALQPKVVTETGIVVGAEALARWRHPNRGLLPPSMFIETAEKSGKPGTVHCGERIAKSARASGFSQSVP